MPNSISASAATMPNSISASAATMPNSSSRSRMSGECIFCESFSTMHGSVLRHVISKWKFLNLLLEGSYRSADELRSCSAASATLCSRSKASVFASLHSSFGNLQRSSFELSQARSFVFEEEPCVLFGGLLLWTFL